MALMYGVSTAIQCRPYYTPRSHQADQPELPPLTPPQLSRARYLCTKSSIIRHEGRQAIYIYVYKLPRYVERIRIGDRQDYHTRVAF